MDECLQPVSLVIVTADRPALAATCISSYVTCERAPASILLMDDSRDLACAEATERLASNLKTITRTPVRCASRCDRRIFVEHLSKEGIDESVASFGLLGREDWFTAGANRNAALLDSDGEKILMADDDTLGSTASYINASSDICLGAHDDPSDICFFDTREKAFTATQWKDADVFAEASRWLGVQLKDLTMTTDDACEHLLTRMRNGSGTVRVVSFGTVGDSGFYSPVHLLWSSSRTISELLRLSEKSLQTALSSREVIRIVPRTTITHGTVCMATAIGLDNRQMSPPFLPIGRNEDGFFGNLLVRCFPADCTAHLPLGIVHQPPEGRVYGRLANQPQTIRLSELIILLLSACPISSDVRSEDALRTLGSHLCHATDSADVFVAYAREIVRSARQRLLNHIEDLWRDDDVRSPGWKRETAHFRQRLRELVDSPDCWMPSELLDHTDSSIKTETCRIIRLTGEFLSSWPDIVEAARRLRMRNVRLSRTLAHHR